KLHAEGVDSEQGQARADALPARLNHPEMEDANASKGVHGTRSRRIQEGRKGQEAAPHTQRRRGVVRARACCLGYSSGSADAHPLPRPPPTLPPKPPKAGTRDRPAPAELERTLSYPLHQERSACLASRAVVNARVSTRHKRTMVPFDSELEPPPPPAAQARPSQLGVDGSPDVRATCSAHHGHRASKPLRLGASTHTQPAAL
ncbi:hypothetical protein B0H16DRAFT_1574345, partial [Mycena metata]